MKKLIVLLLSIFVAMNIFAATGEALEGVSEATLNLTLENQYKFAFIEAAAGGTAPSIGTGQVTPLSEFTLHTTGDALIKSGADTTLKLDKTRNVFYFFYQAYTNQGNLKIKISAPDSLVKDDDPNQKISYKATFYTVSGKWDGDALSSSFITSGSTTASSASAKIKSSSAEEDYNYMGLCKVVISSTEDLGKKKPGNYSAKIYLTLTAN